MAREKKSASIYANSEFMCLRTFSGLGLSGADPEGEIIFLNPDASAEAVGAALIAALAKSRMLSSAEATEFFSLGAVNRRYENWVTMVLAKYAYPSRRKMFKELKNVSADSSADVLLLEPTRHNKLEGWSGDGIPEADHVKLPATASAEEMGKGVFLALSRCRD
ncbi:MAG TPA: contact-dependent growth inhibition system immunity protein [Steroidobacteraceae bacterium]|jgi:hypothetical protein|nr:contact-dependent growth inhibition system immunity protein [Steroidobacteraceae bacterium]